MNFEILTKSDIKEFKEELLNEIREMLSPSLEPKQWLKSADVTKMLNCSPGTLQNLRIKGTLPFTKMGGTIYYSYSDVINVLDRNKKNAA